MQKQFPTIITILAVLVANIFATSIAYAETANDSIIVTAEKCFCEAPPEVLQLISPNTRLDMIDYFKAGIKKASNNYAGGECSVLQLDPESVTIAAGEGIKYQFFVLQGKKRPYIGVIETLKTPCEESMVKFYTTDWTQVDAAKTGLFREPTLHDWLISANKQKSDEAKETLPFIFTAYTYNPANSTLTATNSMDGYYHSTDRPAILKDLRQTITFKWEGKRNAFVMEKK